MRDNFRLVARGSGLAFISRLPSSLSRTGLKDRLMPPMPFWDRFALWVYLGIADLLPVGRDAVARLLEHARATGRLNLSHSNGATLLLVTGACRPGSPARVAAEAQIVHRRLNTQYDVVRGIQYHLTSPRLTEVLEVNRPRRAVMAQLTAGVLMTAPGHEVWTNLTEYLSRVHAESPAAVQPRVTRALLGALQRYYHFPLGTIDFLGLLYRHANGYLGVGRAALGAYAAESAELVQVADVDEQAFLIRCGTQLSEAERVLLFMHFYGRLTVDQIAASLQLADPTWTPDLVVAELERCWMAVL